MKHPADSATIEFTQGKPELHSRGRNLKLSKAILQAGYEYGRELLVPYEPYKNSEKYHYPRIKDFMHSLGLPAIDIYFLDSQKAQEMASDLQEGTNQPIPIEEGLQGFYSPFHNVAGAITSDIKEKYNPPELTESYAVHEAAHAAGLVAASHMWGKDSYFRHYSLRGGFSVYTGDYEGYKQGSGYLLEEGFCELLRGLYVHSILGKPDGFADRMKLDKLREEIAAGDLIWPPNKYFYNSKSGDGDVEIANESLAGFALELLILENPDLAVKVIEARKTPEGLRDLYRTLEATHPGILKDLNELAPRSKDCINGLAYIEGIIDPAVIDSYDPKDVAKLYGL